MTGVSTLDRPPQSVAPTRYTVTLARDEDDVRAAQRLRHDVFAGEMGALLTTPEPGLDVDGFDAHCDHLLVRDTVTGQVVGTYRLLPRSAQRWPDACTPRASSTSRRSTRSARDSSRSAVPACTPTTATAPSSVSSGPGSPATWWTAATNGWPAAAPSRSPTAARSPPAPGTACAPSTWPPRSSGYGRCCPGSPGRRRPPRTPNSPAAARLPPPRRLGVRTARPRPGLRGGRHVRAAVDAPGQRPLPAALPLARPGLMSVWLPSAPCTPGACLERTGSATAVPRAVLRLLAVTAVLLAGIALLPVGRLIPAARSGGGAGRWCGPRGSGSVCPAPPRPRAGCSWSPTTSPGWTSR